MGYFCKKMCCQKLSKIAQFGHSVSCTYFSPKPLTFVFFSLSFKIIFCCSSRQTQKSGRGPMGVPSSFFAYSASLLLMVSKVLFLHYSQSSSFHSLSLSVHCSIFVCPYLSTDSINYLFSFEREKLNQKPFTL